MRIIGSYEVDGQRVVVREVSFAVDGQEGEALALRGELAGELLGGHPDTWLALPAVVGVGIAVHLRD